MKFIDNYSVDFYLYIENGKGGKPIMKKREKNEILKDHMEMYIYPVDKFYDPEPGKIYWVYK